MATLPISFSVEDELIAELNEEIKAVTVNLITGLTLVTPKDSGMAAGNWFVGIANPDRSVEDARRARQAITEGKATINTIINAKTVPKVVISNNLPYIERLNNGWSAQAPAKFVESEISRVANTRKL